jgi:hypothetical protein
VVTLIYRIVWNGDPVGAHRVVAEIATAGLSCRCGRRGGRMSHVSVALSPSEQPVHLTPPPSGMIPEDLTEPAVNRLLNRADSRPL